MKKKKEKKRKEIVYLYGILETECFGGNLVDYASSLMKVANVTMDTAEVDVYQLLKFFATDFKETYDTLNRMLQEKMISYKMLWGIFKTGTKVVG